MSELTRRAALGYSALALSASAGAPQALAAVPRPSQRLLAGKSVIILGLDDPLTRGLKESLAAEGGSVTVVSVPEVNDAAWSTALVTGPTKPVKPAVIVNLCVPKGTGAVGETSFAEFHRILEGSYARAFLAVKYSIIALRDAKGGSLINVTSSDGRYGNPRAAAASATSGGVVIMTKSAALECAAKGDNIRVNGLLIGTLVANAVAKPAPGQVTIADLGAAIAFFASDAAAYLTGVVMPVDNGERAL